MIPSHETNPVNLRDSTNNDAPTVVSRELKQSTSKFSSTMKSAASETSKYQQSNVCSQSSRLSERRRLQSRAKPLEQESRMAIEKKERDLELRRKQRQLELEALQAETEFADLRDQTSLKMQEMKLQIEEVEGCCHGSNISPSLMYLSIDDDKQQRQKLVISKHFCYGSSEAKIAECRECRKRENCDLQQCSSFTK